MTRILTPLAFAVSLVAGGTALADDDDCTSPMSQWQSRDAAVQYVGELGIQLSRMKIDNGCYEIKGQDADSNRIELKLDPASLALVELEVKFRPGSDPSRYLKGAKALAPMQRRAPADNPLFTPGSAPKVNQN